MKQRKKKYAPINPVSMYCDLCGKITPHRVIYGSSWFRQRDEYKCVNCNFTKVST